jgi:hypothetical protein
MTDNQQPSVERTCRTCGEVKVLEDFALVYAKNSRGQNYRQHTCKSCAKVEHATRMRRARANNPQKYREHQRSFRVNNLERFAALKKQSGIRRKLRVFHAYGGPKCVCCGETILSALTIDHINNDGAAHRRELNGNSRGLGNTMYFWLEQNNFPSGFQVLCYNCNISKHRNGGVCEHKLNEGSTTIPTGSSLEAIARRSAGRPRKRPKI